MDEDDGAFSLVGGGPLFRALRSARLVDDDMGLLKRRILALVLISWVPLLVLAEMQGHAWDPATNAVTFVRDVDVHVRFLVALPLLLAAETFAYVRLRPVVAQFVERGLIPARDRPRFEAALASAARWRDSWQLELALVALVYTVGVGLIWRQVFALGLPTWYATPTGGSPQPTWAGWWLILVSLPLVQLLLLRWYVRLAVWAQLLWRFSRLDLQLVPLHPDATGGLGFLSLGVLAFVPFLLAQGALLSGTLASQILHEGAKLPDFELLIAATAFVAVAFVAAPLLVFSPKLAKARRDGLQAYAAMGDEYARGFSAKWLRPDPPSGEMLGTPDVQALSDLANSYAVVRGMRLVPLTRKSLTILVAATLLPIAPLVLTMIPVEEVVRKLARLVL